MKTAVLNIKIDPKVKKAAQKVADELGFSLSSIVNASLKNLARDKAISFSVFEQTPTKKKIAEWEAISDEMDANIKNQKEFPNADDLLKHLKLSV